MLKNIDGKLVYIGYTGNDKPDFIWNGREIPPCVVLPHCEACVYDALMSGCEALCATKERYISALSDD